MGIDRRVELSAHFGLYYDSLLCRRSAIDNCGDDSKSIRVMFQWRSTDASSLILLDVSRAGRANVSVNLTPVEENDDTNAVLSYMCGYQGTQYLNLGIVKIARAWSVLFRLCAFNDG